MTEDQFAVLMTVLYDIRDAVLALSVVEEVDDDPDVCQHPEEARVSLATPGDPFRWICNQCRYEHRGVTRN